MVENKSIDNSEISLADIISIIKELISFFKARFLIIAIFGFSFGILFGIRNYLENDSYIANLTFMINEDEGGGPSSIGSILGQFGLGGGSGDYSLDKIIALSKSRKIISETVFQKGELNGKVDFWANHLIKMYSLKGAWYNRKVDMSGFNGFIHGDVEKFTNAESNALLTLEKLLNEELFKSDYEQESSIMTMSLKTKDQIASTEIVRNWFDQLGSFYVEKSIEKQKRTFTLLSNKADSIKSLLSGAEYKTLDFESRNRNLIIPRASVPLVRASRDKSILTLMYGEAVKNVEIADFALKSKTPFIQAIDLPLTPIVSEKKGIIGQVGRGGIFGGIIGCLVLLIIFWWRKISRN
jgi:hypothetical protein